MWRKLQELGLRTTCIQEKSVRQFCRKPLPLPVPRNSPLRFLYYRVGLTMWNQFGFPVELLPVFRKSVRTNNDVEGWHLIINPKAGKASLPFYVLLSLLYDEATSVVTQIQMVSEKS
ncbi:hypothetical protein CHS0354_021689 [Potamilus streckersoni]|uniref:Uncharacterized protein n=1 Tax=Potamilus streckersoni TaxID=2493646 RepID=A0AAE0WGW8_9BIVA|nr:hypothetical protein CHS0354_021689 [Potamilus streckersoni]